MGYNVKTGNQKADTQHNQFRTFEDLEVYQVAREFAKMRQTTKKLWHFSMKRSATPHRFDDLIF